MRKGLIFVFLLTVSAILVFAGLSDNIRVEVRDDATWVEVRNYNDSPVTVSLSIG